jgi:dynein heavy chain 1
LIAQDIVDFKDILEEVFPGSYLFENILECNDILSNQFGQDIVALSSMEDDLLRAEMAKSCESKDFVPDDGFIQKMLQLKQVIEMRHGIMVVGKSGVGKVWRVNIYVTSF